MLRVDGPAKRHGALLALDDLAVQVHPGQVVGFGDPNSAGRTTTTRAIMRLTAPAAGKVTRQANRSGRSSGSGTATRRPGAVRTRA